MVFSWREFTKVTFHYVTAMHMDKRGMRSRKKKQNIYTANLGLVERKNFSFTFFTLETLWDAERMRRRCTFTFISFSFPLFNSFSFTCVFPIDHWPSVTSWQFDLLFFSFFLSPSSLFPSDSLGLMVLLMMPMGQWLDPIIVQIIP